MNTLNVNPVGQNVIKDSTTQSFAVDVIEASKTQPVLVDFWAPWCGPCKTLGPIIEKVVREAGGKVKLVKVDIDQNPEIAGQLRVQSIPAVFAFVGGKPVDGFMGALPESQVKQFVNRLSSMGSRAEQIAEALQMASEAFATSDFEAAIDIAGQIIAAEPSTAEAYALKAKAEMEMGQLDDAAATLTACPEDKLSHPLVISAKASLDRLLNPVDTSGQSKLEAAIATNPDDHAARLELANLLNGTNHRDEATDHLIYVIKRDRIFGEDAARKQLVSYFEAWGPKDEATLAARRKLSSVLFS